MNKNQETMEMVPNRFGIMVLRFVPAQVSERYGTTLLRVDKEKG